MKKPFFLIVMLIILATATATAQTTQKEPSVRVGAYTVTKNTEAPYLLLELFDAGQPIAGSFSPEAMIKYIASKGVDVSEQKQIEIYYLSRQPLPERLYWAAGVRKLQP